MTLVERLQRLRERAARGSAGTGGGMQVGRRSMRETLQVATNELADQRRSICETCDKYREKPIAHCAACGCPIRPKTLSLRATCPLNKW